MSRAGQTGGRSGRPPSRPAGSARPTRRRGTADRAVPLAAALLLAAAGAAAAEDRPAVAWGADLRVRQEYYDHVPSPDGGHVDGGTGNALRVRPRAWVEWAPAADLALRARVVEEFRHVWSPEDQTQWKYPDEIVVDALYLDTGDLAGGRLRLRAGRQDLGYGNGMLVADGTPADESRTLYFDAVKATWTGVARNSIDLLAIYNRPENELALNSSQRDLTSQTGGPDGIAESGGGLYGRNTFFAILPFEYYYLFKRESEWERPATPAADGGPAPPARAWQRLDPDTGVIGEPELDLHTVGARVQPHLAEGVVATIEAAGQVGERGPERVRAYGLDAKLRAGLAEGLDASAGLYRLSGDDPATARDEGWNPLWSRTPQYSDLYSLSFPVRRWSNLNMIHAGLSLSPAEGVRCEARVAHLDAVERDGPGGGGERGWLGTLKAAFPLGEDLLTAGDRLTGHALIEWLWPGDYHDTGETAVFARWQVQYEF